MIMIQILAALIAVVAFSINLEIPKKYLFVSGIIGAIGWVTYLICSYFNFSVIASNFISALVIAILSLILSKTLKAVSSVFLIPAILPIVPGVAMYRTVYALINNNLQESAYYLIEAIFIAGGIAFATFITESIKNTKIMRKEKQNENTI